MRNYYENFPIRTLSSIELVGVINTSPDSYFHSSTVDNVEAALDVARIHIQHGAHYVEVGGLSGGSAAKRVSEDAEFDRTVPVVKAIADEFPQVTVIVDTFRSRVARGALEVGARWINDVTALTYDPEMVNVAKEFNADVVMMHLEGKGGASGRKLNRANYVDVVKEVYDFLASRVKFLEESGISKEKIVVDVGLGAGKRPFHDYELLANLNVFNGLGCRQMSAISRKQYVEAISPVKPEERLGGSIAGAIWSMIQGCSLLRVHEVRPYAQAIDVWSAIIAEALRKRDD